MAKEIERKFLIADSSWRDHVETRLHFIQFYLAADPGRSIRIRIIGAEQAVLTLKFSGPGKGRDEYEYPVPLAEAQEMRAFAIGRVIEKTRHHVRYGGYLYEVDEFAGALAGLVIAELETPDLVPDDNLPRWLGREVTDDARYYNARLALDQSPEPPE